MKGLFFQTYYGEIININHIVRLYVYQAPHHKKFNSLLDTIRQKEIHFLDVPNHIEFSDIGNKKTIPILIPMSYEILNVMHELAMEYIQYQESGTILYKDILKSFSQRLPYRFPTWKGKES